jgi:predicted nucleotidyltransferase component of viral defense system
MRQEAIDKKTQSVLGKIAALQDIRQFYLAGGTALALQLGHRGSVDLDFFSKNAFHIETIKQELAAAGNLYITLETVDTLDGALDDVKVSFFEYRYDILFPLLSFQGVAIADLRDIAAMKLTAISSRGSKKDFIDFYFLLDAFPLPELLQFFEEKFRGIEYSTVHLLKSLSYFEDAEEEPMPRMLVDVSWEQVKKRILMEVNGFLG